MLSCCGSCRAIIKERARTGRPIKAAFRGLLRCHGILSATGIASRWLFVKQRFGFGLVCSVCWSQVSWREVQVCGLRSDRTSRGEFYSDCNMVGLVFISPV